MKTSRLKRFGGSLLIALLHRSKPILVLIPLCFPLALDAQEWVWSADAGFNYDFISHDYYLLTIDTLGISSDSLEELKLYNDRIDEKGVNLRLALERNGAARFTIANRIYLTDEKIRDLLSLRLEWGLLRLDTETDLKSYGFDDEFSLYDDRLQNQSRISFAVLDRDRWRVELSEEFEYSGYSNRSSSVYGYRQYETRLRLYRDLADFSQLNLSLRYDQRDTYDSSALDFSRFIVESGIDQIGSQISLQANVFLERKNYSNSAVENNYIYLSPYFDLDWSLSEQWALAPRIELNYYGYDREELATFSHLRTDSEMLLQYHYSLLSYVDFGIGQESFIATHRDHADQDFHSVQALAGFESMASTDFTISLDTEFGHRNFTSAESSFYSDHWFLRFDLYADWQVAQGLRLSVIGGTDFEYHDKKEDDAFLYLLSANLTYAIH